MLSIYRRHRKNCPFKADRISTKCRCAWWAKGTLESKPYQKSLKTRNKERAEKIIRTIEKGEQQKERPKSVSIKDALGAFISDCEARALNSSTLRKYKSLRDNLASYAEGHRLCRISELDTAHVRVFRESRSIGPRTASKELERLRAFFKFCVENDWIAKNPAKAIKAPEFDVKPTLPFSEEEQKRIRKEAVALSRGSGRIPSDPRLPVFIDLLLETGLRIGDAGLLQTSEIQDEKLMLHTNKSRGAKVVWMPLSPNLLAGLKSITPKGGYFFINSDSTTPATVAEYWRVRVKRVCARAGLPKAHPHQFRDTASVNWLLNGVDIPTVAALLGNTPRIVEKHYAPWVPSRQALLTAAVQKSWTKPVLVRVK